MAGIGHLVSGAFVVYSILVSAFLSPVLISMYTDSCFASGKLPADHELDSPSGLFDPLPAAEREEDVYNLDHELGIVTPSVEREGSTSSSGKSSIRIVASHFSGRNSSGSEISEDAAEDSADDSSPNDEPFEMISDSDVRSDGTV